MTCNLLDDIYLTLYNARKDVCLHLALLCFEEKVNLRSALTILYSKWCDVLERGTEKSTLFVFLCCR